MSKKAETKKNPEPEKGPEIFEEVPKQSKTQELPAELEVLEFPEEVNVKELVNRRLILLNATIDEGANFNVVHLIFRDSQGNEILARTTSKAIEMQVRRLMARGLGNGKAFEVCIKMSQSKYGTPMVQFVSPKLCQ